MLIQILVSAFRKISDFNIIKSGNTSFTIQLVPETEHVLIMRDQDARDKEK